MSAGLRRKEQSRDVPAPPSASSPPPPPPSTTIIADPPPDVTPDPSHTAAAAAAMAAAAMAAAMATPAGGEGATPAVLKVRKPYTVTKPRQRARLGNALWTDEEHRKFKEALKQYGRAWQRIQEHIGTKTAKQIRNHADKWFAKLRREAAAGNGTNTEGETVDTIPPPRAHTTWTDEEHHKFKEAFKKHGQAWQRIQEHIGTKTTKQIQGHAQKWFLKLKKEAAAGNGTNTEGETVDTIPPPRAHTTWTDEEHRKFKEAFKQYGRAWQRIQEHIGTKTTKQIQSHADNWFSKLRQEAAAGNGTNAEGETVDTIPPPRARTTWTDEEHRKFEEAHKQYGPNWQRIQEHIGTKTTKQIQKHADNWFSKLRREAAAGNGTNAEGETVDTIPPPRAHTTWTDEEHRKFEEAHKQYGPNWQRIQEHIGTKTTRQIRGHAEKWFFSKLKREAAAGNGTNAEGETVDPLPPLPPQDKNSSKADGDTQQQPNQKHSERTPKSALPPVPIAGFRGTKAIPRFRGVSYNKYMLKFASRCKVFGRGIHLGTFSTAIEAAFVRDAAWRALGGPSEFLNFADSIPIDPRFKKSVEHGREKVLAAFRRAAAEKSTVDDCAAPSPPPSPAATTAPSPPPSPPPSRPPKRKADGDTQQQPMSTRFKGTPKALPKLDNIPVEYIGEELLRELTGPITAAAKPPGRRRHAGVRTVLIFLPAMGTNAIEIPVAFPALAKLLDYIVAREGLRMKDVSRVQVNVNAVRHALHLDPITSRQRIFVISIGAQGLFSWGGVVFKVEPGSVLAWTKATQERHGVVGGDAGRFSVAVTVEE